MNSFRICAPAFAKRWVVVGSGWQALELLVLVLALALALALAIVLVLVLVLVQSASEANLQF